MNDPNLIHYEHLPHNIEDPLPTLALFLDQGSSFDPRAKAAFLRGLDSKCRQFFLPVAKPLARSFVILNQAIKMVAPDWLTSPKLLHRLIYLGLKYFASPEANLLIMRHFHLGSEVLQFIRDNTKGVDVPLMPLKPRAISDVKKNLFVQHDINLYNFIIRYNQELRKLGLSVPPAAKHLDFSAITDGPCDMEAFDTGWHNFLDLETAIEIYTPVFQLFLTDNDFWRASNSLQLDETIGLYVSHILGDHSHMWRVNNKHPLVPLSILRAGYRLVLHGMSTEGLHYMLRMLKRKQQASSAA